jgi:pantetheine-phosphate adenylyltransferase
MKVSATIKTINKAIQMMESLNLPSDSIFEAWNEPHRFYHNKEHLLELISKIDEWTGIDQTTKENLYVIAFYHDIVYNPKMVGTKSNDRYGFTNTGWNEAESAYRFMNDVEENEIFDTERKLIIFDAICATGRRELPTENTACLFWIIDNKVLEKPFADLLIYERKIEQEFQFVSWPEYRNARVDFLRKEAIRLESEDLNRLADFVWNRRPSIAIYPGSFNPFHKGHFDILQKAERMFDKVIIVKGKNPDKEKVNTELPERLQFHEVIEWDRLTTDLIKELSNHSEVVLLRGLRNGKDLDYEVNQMRFMESMYPDLQVCFIQCSREYEHVSSSAIRKLREFGDRYADEYLI